MILQLANVLCVKLQGESFDWLGGLVFLLGWTEAKAPLHLFHTNFELKSQMKFSVVYFTTTE
jgi:hypothetical protein